MSEIKEVNIQNGTYKFFVDMTNIKNFHPNQIKIDKKSYKSIDICYIEYIAVTNFSYTKINSVDSLYLIIDKADWYIGKTNGNKYLTLVFNDKNKEYWQNTQNFGIILKI